MVRKVGEGGHLHQGHASKPQQRWWQIQPSPGVGKHHNTECEDRENARGGHPLDQSQAQRPPLTP